MTEVLGSLLVNLALDTSEFARGSNKAQRELRALQDKFTSIGEAWNRAGRNLSVGLTLPLGIFAVASIKAASDANELQSAFDQTFGGMSNAMNAWAEATGDAMGRSTQAMQRAANTFGIFFMQAAPTAEAAADMSKEFSVLAQDLASFHNVDVETAIGKLRSGLTGEAEPMRDFGVFLNAAKVNAKALEMGLARTTEEITEQDKILARYNIIMAATKVAQGDVERTGGSMANQLKALSNAMIELKVAIGEKLLPVFTPLINLATRMINAFTSLPSGVQTTIVVIGALVASIGPLMLLVSALAVTLLPLFAAKFGVVGLALSAFLNPVGTAIVMFGQWAAAAGGLAALKAVGATLLRLAGPVGLIVSLGLLIYNNWDRVSAVFAKFWEQAKQTLGPPLKELIGTLQKLFNEFWNGPMGEGIRSAINSLGEFSKVVGAALGDALIKALKFALDFVILVFEQIADAIKVVNAVLNGDWQTAWDAAVKILTRFTVPFKGAATAIVGYARSLSQGIQTWLQDKLRAVFDWVGGKVEEVKGYFFGLYDAVVGHSYVPDLIDGIAYQFARLGKVMVKPARNSAEAVKTEYRQMASEVSGLLDRLFPQVAKMMKMRKEFDSLGKAGLSDSVVSEARGRLIRETFGKATVSVANTGPLVAANDVSESISILSGDLGKLGDQTQVQTVRIADSFKDMAQDTVSALEGLSNSIKSGGFLDILGGAIDLFLRLGSTGLFGAGLAGNINKPSIPGYANGTSFHPGGLAIVGERGPELVNMGRGAQVFTNSEMRGMAGGNMQIEVVATNDGFGAFVRDQAGRVVASSAPALMAGGAATAHRQAARRQTRRIG